jgi:hypothetical protein
MALSAAFICTISTLQFSSSSAQRDKEQTQPLPEAEGAERPKL